MVCSLVVERSRRAVPLAVLLAASLSGWFAWSAIAEAQIFIGRGRFDPAHNATDEDYSGVYLPTDRTLARAMARAAQRIQDGEYHETLAFLDQILGREEDAFLDGATDPKQLLGLKASARRLIADLPPAGRAAYELLYGAAARRQLKEALASGDREAVSRVVRQYFYTSAGMEAALVFAQIELDSGHPLAAAQLYQDLLDTPAAEERFDPQLSVLAALSWQAAGKPERALAILRSLGERFPNAQVDVAGRPVKVPGPDADPVAWLRETVGEPKSPDRTEQDWITQRGNAERNAEHSGGAPHLRARWEARVVNDPRLESLLSSRSRQYSQLGVAAVPAARPLAVGDLVLMRTPTNVVAIDWNTGKRIWETREEIDNRQDQLATEFMNGEQDAEWPEANRPLEQRVWEDALAMSLGSDGERVYVIGGLSMLSPEDPSRWGMMPVFGGPEETTGSTNRLAAYDLATEGKLVWELDGSSRSGAFAGAFFLGPPLAVDDSIFVITELRGALYLMSLDPRTGRLQWRQQLANLEQGVALDPLRRLVGTSPSYSAGILVCPTASGMVVAVDVVKRQFAWVYRYPFRQQTPAEMQNAWQHRVQQQQNLQNDRWLDGDVVVADGKVFISPPESSEIYCLDLQTGELLWKQVREDSLFIGCADAGNVLLVGSESLRILRGQDGAHVTPSDRLSLPSGVLPAGHGYLSEGRYYLPLTTGQILVVDVARGRIVDTLRANPGTELGNLVSHRGTVISQSALLLDKFEQIDVLKQRVADSLARDPNDATALRELAEMTRVEGDLSEAVRLLKRAYQITPEDPLVREMLAESLLEVLATDYASHQDDLSLLTKLISGHQQQVTLLRIKAAGLQSLGKRNEAFEAYLSMADLAEPQGTSIRIGPEHSVRADRWIRGRLNTLWSEASPSERQSISNTLAARRRSWGDHPTASQLHHYLAHFDGLPGTDETRIQLAQSLVESQNVQEAELELLRLERSPKAESRAAAAVLMTKLLMSIDRRGEAEPYVATLAGRWSNVVALDGKTGLQWLSELGLDAEAARDGSGDRWPRGRIATEVIPTSSPQNTTARQRQLQTMGFLRSLRLEQVYPTAMETPQWFLTDNFRRLVGRNKWGKDIYHIDFRRSRQSSNVQVRSNLVHGAQLGHLLYVCLGKGIVALDSRQFGDDVLWQVSSENSGPPSPTRNRGRKNPIVYHGFSGRQRAFGPQGTLYGSLGPVTPTGVVLLDQDELKCVDPISGETLWSRSDVPQACELFGDDQLVFVADVEQGTAQVFSAVDGTLLGERKLPEFPWLLTAGRNVVQISTDIDFKEGPYTSLRVTDVWSGQTLFESKYHAMTGVDVIEPNLVLVAYPGQEARFQCIDARTGKVLVEQQIDPIDANKPERIHALVSQDTLYLLIDSEALQQHRPIGTDYPVVTGDVYAFDLKTGKPLWPGPAFVRHRGIALAQPSSIPLLVFVDREEKRDATAGSSSHLRLLCLDKRTGETVFRDDELPDTAGGHFRIFAERGEQPTISIEMSNRTVRLMLTDEPRPPAPPANDDVEAARKSLGRGLWDVGRRMGDVLQDALQNPGGTIWPDPASHPQQNQPPGGQNLFDDD